MISVHVVSMCFFGLSVLLFSWGLVIDDVHVTYLVTCLPFLESGLCETTTVAVRASNYVFGSLHCNVM